MNYPSGREQRDIFARLCGSLVPPLAIYVLCAVYNVPYVSAASDCESWADYIASIDGVTRAVDFASGETDVQTAVVTGMEDETRWTTVWGDGYSRNDYIRLDDLYRTMTAQLDAAGGFIDKQQEDTARYCSRLALEREKLIRKPTKDNVAMAKNLDEMIRKNLQDCNMRKADVLPSQMQKIDGFVDAARKKFGIDGEMTYDQVMNAFYKWCRQRKHPQTVDAEEHALYAILKTMQQNDDQPVPAELPESMRLTGFEYEFGDSPNEQEDEVYNYLHLVRENFGSAVVDGGDS